MPYLQDLMHFLLTYKYVFYYACLQCLEWVGWAPVEEFKRGQRYSNFKTNELNTSEGQGGQVCQSSSIL